MNKLILVGNGFDLAHGLPTSYTHFLNNFWETFPLKFKDDFVKDIVQTDESYFWSFNYGRNSIKSFKSLILYLKNYCKEYHFPFSEEEIIAYDSDKIIFKFKNDFFKKINFKESIQNWVDIENEYYSELKRIVKAPKDNLLKSDDIYLKEKKQNVVRLNKEFEEVKELLIKHLRKNVLQRFDLETIENKEDFLKMFEIFKPNSSLNGNEWNQQEFSFANDSKHINKIYNEEKNNENIFCESYIVDFNYTGSSFIYFNEIRPKDSIYMFENGNINSIHGEIDAEGFEPVFGFGDEIDKDYKLIENLDDNEYLKHFKSFQYFQNKCYDGVLKFIDQEKFQVCILGHSCGLSDRVMLNTIFEHENCRSIKIYYHQKEDGTDNYLDVVKNISRHFKDKPSMRRKIVSKELSSPLPQNVRFKRK